MTIQRNGTTYELTDRELLDAYEERRRYYAKCDIIEKHEQLIEDDRITNVALTDEVLERILSRFERYIGRNDLYWDIYWEIVRSAIIDHFEEENV